MCNKKEERNASPTETQHGDAPEIAAARGCPSDLVKRLEALFVQRLESGDAFECSSCEAARSGSCH
jgi:hypothetical protein